MTHMKKNVCDTHTDNLSIQNRQETSGESCVCAYVLEKRERERELKVGTEVSKYKALQKRW